MTPEQIKEEIREFLALSEDATAGPWDASSNVVSADVTDGYYMVTCDSQKTSMQQDVYNAFFIASSRNISPAMAKALLNAIEGHEEVIACFNVAEFEGLQERLSEQKYETGNLRDLIERRIYHAKLASETAIKTICRTWEESK